MASNNAVKEVPSTRKNFYKHFLNVFYNLFFKTCWAQVALQATIFKVDNLLLNGPNLAFAAGAYQAKLCPKELPITLVIKQCIAIWRICNILQYIFLTPIHGNRTSHPAISMFALHWLQHHVERFVSHYKLYLLE